MSVGTAAEAGEYLLVETRQGDTVELFARDAVTLASAGHRVRLLLIGDGVGAAAGRPPRRSPDSWPPAESCGWTTSRSRNAPSHSRRWSLARSW
ncbi:hypothetical protein NKG94_03200 [Micromonospora sp. M12]